MGDSNPPASSLTTASQITELIRPMTEDALIELVTRRSSETKFLEGAAASVWTQKFARGRTDADFGILVGLSGDNVYQRRRVWEQFGNIKDRFPRLKWSHFYRALTWEDRVECLEWAELNEATVAEMHAWMRAKNGLPLLGRDSQDSSDDAVPRITSVDPQTSAAAKAGESDVIDAEFEAKPGGEQHVSFDDCEVAPPRQSVRDDVAGSQDEVLIEKAVRDLKRTALGSERSRQRGIDDTGSLAGAILRALRDIDETAAIDAVKAMTEHDDHWKRSLRPLFKAA